jgi:dTDP-4-amino-4,6-dideoxygalactose transaminase
MINVTKTFFPPIADYQKQIQYIWDNQWLTNRGSLVLELEEKLTEYLALQESKMIIMNNGTIPLQIAMKLLGKGGEIITTPFSYVATTAAIVWENCIPVFVDINPKFLTIDETKIEAAITEKTTCILATHVFGNPCNIEVIEAIANKHNLKVIYDAAHCFGVTYKGKSIFEYGDISTCSFHATKLFHTGEGGALFTKDSDLFHKCFYSHTFGHLGPLDYHGVGINGKISELQAAMGLTVLPHMELIIQERKKVVNFYINNLNFVKVRSFQFADDTTWNYSYFPIVFESVNILIKVQQILNNNNIFPRRYFYPSLNKIEYTNGGKMSVSESIADRIMCLPLYVGLTQKELNEIVNLINSNL